MENLLTLRQAARVLQISPRTLEDYGRKGLVARVKIGKLVRFRPDDLSEWIAARRHGRSEPAKPVTA